MNPITVGATVKHRSYLTDQDFVGTVEEISDRFGALVFWENTKQTLRHPLHFLVCEEDAEALVDPQSNRKEIVEEDEGDADADNPTELSLAVDRHEEIEDESREIEEGVEEPIAEAVDSDPLPEAEEIEELVEDET